MFEDHKTRSGVKIILPHLEPRPVSQQLVKRPIPLYKKRPHTVAPIEHRMTITPLEKLKLLRKIQRTCTKHI